MSKITKDNKGITLVALILTIIIMLILVSVTTYTGIDIYKESRVSAFVSQMQLIQKKIDDAKNTKTIDELLLLGDAVNSINQTNTINLAFSNNEISSNDANSYRYFTKDKLLELFDVDDAYDDVLVNFTTREIVSLNGVEYKGKTYYTQYQLPNGQKVISSDYFSRNLAFSLETLSDGLNCVVTIDHVSINNGTISFAETDIYGNKTNWQTVTNCTEQEHEYKTNISKSGNYTFKLKDNADDNYIEKTIVIILTNKPKTNIDLQPYTYGVENSKMWAYVQKDGVNYVWIPRLAYKTNTDTNFREIKFIKGNSNIATDNTYINNEWTTPNKFTLDDGTKLTGVWVNVESPNQENLDMINLLNDTSRTVLTTI